MKFIDRFFLKLYVWVRHLIEDVFYARDLERFYLVFGGHIYFQALHAAVRFDLFTRLEHEPGLTRKEIADRIGIQEQPARILLLGLVTCGLLKKNGDRYLNKRLSRQLFSKTSPKNIINYVYLQHHGMYKAMPRFFDALKQYKNVGLEEFAGSEGTFYERMAHNPELADVFQKAMQELSVQTNEKMSQFLDLSKVNQLVDVGGGNGTNALALARKNPHLKATVFDLPAVVDIAEKNIKKQSGTDRVAILAGNCFQDPFPKNADAFLFCHFFTMWSREKDTLLLKKAFEALPSGGRAIIYNMMQHNEETGPFSAAIGSPYFLTLASGEGMLYTWNDYISFFKEAGFVNITTEKLPVDHGIIVGIKP